MDFSVITAPHHYIKPFHLFLAGGITNCPNWQASALHLLQSASWLKAPLVVMNPRREDFNVKDPSESERQIKWEHAMLNTADGVFFWFPKDTLCPITLFELGKMAPRGMPLFVGCDPGYQRKKDVEVQLGLIRPEVTVRSTMEKTVGDVLYYLMTHDPLQYEYEVKGPLDGCHARGSADRAVL